MKSARWGEMDGGAGLVVSRRSGFAYSGCPIRQKVARPIMCISPRFILQS